MEKNKNLSEMALISESSVSILSDLSTTVSDLENDVLMSSDSIPKELNNLDNLHRNLTPIELQQYSTSPGNRFSAIRSNASPTSTESIDGDTNSRNSVCSMDENILELECTLEGVDEDDGTNALSYARFVKAHSCYDIIPSSSKIVVFDTKLKVKKAFFALVHNNIRSAPIWDTGSHEFVGMLTITDFINILIRYYTSPLVKMWELEEHQIATWREMSTKKLPTYLIRISPKESIYTAVEMLVKNRIHRLPVIDPRTGNAIYILTHKKILRYIFQHLDDLPMPDFMGYSLGDLGIGSYENVATVNPWTTVIEALHIFNSRGVSALPIVDKDNHCVDIYSKFDVINLAAERTYNNLNITMLEALKHRQEGFEGVHKCHPKETLYVVISRIMNAKVHRLVVVDDSDSVLGIISLSDILRFVILRPPKSSS